MIKLKKWLFIGIALELAIMLSAYLMFTETGEMFRYAARYSGRLSLLAFLAAIWYFMLSKPQSESQLKGTRSLTLIFSVLHYIHLFLLGMNVNLNAVTLIPHKLAGGSLAYLMILLYPIFFECIKHNKAIHAIYFLYVGFVMAMTYKARMKGDFEGAKPELFHKLGLAVVLLSMGYFLYQLVRSKKQMAD
jgi:hypothetical protein